MITEDIQEDFDCSFLELELDADLSEVEGDLSRHSEPSDMDLEGYTLQEEALDDPAPIP